MASCRFLLLAVIVICLADLCDASPAPLPHLNIQHDLVSISGLSSGADFVVQFQVAFSSILRGSGVFAGQPYHCAVTRFDGEPTVPMCSQMGCTPSTPGPSVPICNDCPPGQTLRYDHCKNEPQIVNTQLLADNARRHAQQGLIDSVENLKRARIYLYRGTKDAIYLKGSMQKVEDMFRDLGVTDILFNNTTPSAHSWPTVSYGTPCGHGVIEACNYDGPGACFQHIYNGSMPPVDADPSSLVEFDQRPFMTPDNNGTAHYNETTPHVTGLAPAGYIYVPKACAAGSPCGLHLSLHGCDEEQYYVEAVEHLGFQRHGEANNVVIMFPRVQPHGSTVQTQSGCWDAYAQSGADYAFKSGAQMHAVREMIRAVAGW